MLGEGPQVNLYASATITIKKCLSHDTSLSMHRVLFCELLKLKLVAIF